MSPLLKPTLELERRIFERGDLVISFSDWAASSVIDDYGIPASKVKVVRNGVTLPPPLTGLRHAMATRRTGTAARMATQALAQRTLSSPLSHSPNGHSANGHGQSASEPARTATTSRGPRTVS